MSGDDEGRSAPGWRDAARERYTAARIDHWDAVARDLDRRRGLGGGYHRRLADVYRHVRAARVGG